MSGKLIAAVVFNTISDAALSANLPQIRTGMLFLIWPVKTFASGLCTPIIRLIPVERDSLASVDICPFIFS